MSSISHVSHIALQGAATWWIYCHDPRATCHIAGCKNSTRHIENLFSPYFIFFCFLNAVWALTNGGFDIVSDTLVFFLEARSRRWCTVYRLCFHQIFTVGLRIVQLTNIVLTRSKPWQGNHQINGVLYKNVRNCDKYIGFKSALMHFRQIFTLRRPKSAQFGSAVLGWSNFWRCHRTKRRFIQKFASVGQYLALSWKWYKIGSSLQRNSICIFIYPCTDRNLYTFCRMVSFPATRNLVLIFTNFFSNSWKW